jgi:hypothetical protein
LGQDEIAFYDALANNESAVRELGDDILKKIAIEITEKLAGQHDGRLAGARERPGTAANPGAALPAESGSTHLTSRPMLLSWC